MNPQDQQAAGNTFRSVLCSLMERSQDENFHECLARAVFLRDFDKAGELILGAYLDDVKCRAGRMPASIDFELFGGELGEAVPVVVSYEKIAGYIHVLAVDLVTEKQVPFDLFKSGLLEDGGMNSIMDAIIAEERHTDAA